MFATALWLSPASGSEANLPVVFWASQPVLPGETVYAQGHSLQAINVDVAVLDGEPGAGPPAPSMLRAALAAAQFRAVAPHDPVPSSLRFTLPEPASADGYHLYAFRIENAVGTSDTLLLNNPRIWWIQGSGGSRKGIAGEWLRVNGSCLDFHAGTRALLVGPAGESIALDYVKGTIYSAEFRLPDQLRRGTYTLFLHNGLGGLAGWSEGSTVEIVPPMWPDEVYNISQFAEDFSVDKRAYTPGIIYARNHGNENDLLFAMAIAAAAEDGGGIVYIPRGHYKMNQTILLPPNVLLKGEHRDLVTLDWGDRPVALPALIQGTSRFGVEDLSLLAGNHRDGIAVAGRQKPGRGDVRIRRVLIKLDRMSPVTRRNFTPEEIKENYHKRLWIDRSAAIRVSGDNIEVSDCDLMTVPSIIDAAGIYLERAKGAYISGNKVLSSFRTSIYINGSENMVFTENEITGGFFIGTHHTMILASEDEPGIANDGSFVEQPFLRTDVDKNLYLNTALRNLYISRNQVRHALLADSEITTLDSHYPLGIYVGGVESAQDTRTILAADTVHPQIWGEHWEDLNYWAGAALYILDGRGAGQYRRVMPGSQGREIVIDSPWDVVPDETSLVSLAKLHERLIFEDNEYMDGGVFQLWGGSVECVVSGNTFTRTGAITSRSGHIYNGLVPDWYSQFVGNGINQAGGIGTSTYPYHEDGVSYGHDVMVPGREREPHPPSRRYGTFEPDRSNWTHQRVFTGPITRGVIYRRNWHRMGSFGLSGYVDGAVIENNRGVHFNLNGAQGIRSPINVFERRNERY